MEGLSLHVRDVTRVLARLVYVDCEKSISSFLLKMGLELLDISEQSGELL